MSQAKKEVRKLFNDECLRRDRNRCRVCGAIGTEAKLSVHHITDRNEMPNGGYVKENGITLCDEKSRLGGGGSCHQRAEEFHVSEGMFVTAGFHPDDLYNQIGSSFDLAYEKSLLIGADDLASRRFGRIKVQYRKGEPMIAYLYFPLVKGDKRQSYQSVQKSGVVIDYSNLGYVLGVEILNPSMSQDVLNRLLAEFGAKPLSDNEARGLVARIGQPKK